MRPPSARSSTASTTPTELTTSTASTASTAAVKRMSDVSLFTESINVIVRCRGRGPRENETNSPNVIQITPQKPREVRINIPEGIKVNVNQGNSNDSDDLKTRTYLLDQTFGPSTDQMTFFQNSAENVCNDFMKGFNCTIFAYGQTGAGKTYTMCGKIREDLTLTAESGIIPRCLKKIFEAEGMEDTILKCSFVEIYNENLKDLLSDGSNDKNLRIFEQEKNIIKIKGLEEFYIKDFNEAMKIFKIGLDRKKTASTKMNQQSSRSHTIFTIYLMKKRSNGLEYQFSKINLVDLAGSENIQRSGSINMRAKEAGSINQSLLTLGRVINCLVDGSVSFIPYRESKLTRLLQDSLGGKTKTILIANVAPTLIDIHSSISTLEYASKAKNIKNTAQIGPTINEDFLLSELVEENRKLKLDLIATRRRENCVVVDDSNYKEMYLNQKNLKDEVEELRGMRGSLLKQLENQISKFENEKEINGRLSTSIMELEKRVIDNKSVVLEMQESERRLRREYDDMCNRLNAMLKSANEHEQFTRRILSEKILKSIEKINRNVNDGKINEAFSEKGETILKEMYELLEVCSKDMVQFEENCSTHFTNLREWYEMIYKRMERVRTMNSERSILLDNISENLSESREMNEQLHDFLNDDSKGLLRREMEGTVKEEMKLRIKSSLTQFKQEFLQRIDEFIGESVSEVYYDSVVDHQRGRLEEVEHELYDKYCEIDGELQQRCESMIEQGHVEESVVDGMMKAMDVQRGERLKDEEEQLGKKRRSVSKGIREMDSKVNEMRDVYGNAGVMTREMAREIGEEAGELNATIKEIVDADISNEHDHVRRELALDKSEIINVKNVSASVPCTPRKGGRVMMTMSPLRTSVRALNRSRNASRGGSPNRRGGSLKRGVEEDQLVTVKRRI